MGNNICQPICGIYDADSFVLVLRLIDSCNQNFWSSVSNLQEGSNLSFKSIRFRDVIGYLNIYSLFLPYGDKIYFFVIQLSHIDFITAPQ